MPKQKSLIKDSEARIMVYLSVVHPTRRSVTSICHVLELGYGYGLQILQGMNHKGWVYKHKVRRNMFYSLTTSAPLEDAKLLYNTQSLQHSLEAYTRPEVPEIASNEATEPSMEDDLNTEIARDRIDYNNGDQDEPKV